MNCCKAVSVGASLGAAGFWLWSAMMSIPDTTEMKIGGDESPSGYMKRQSRVSAVAALLAVIGAIASWFA